MEDFKIEHFKKNNPVKNFPVFRSLSSSEAKIIFQNLAKHIDVKDKIGSASLSTFIYESGKVLTGVSAINGEFSLLKILERLKIELPENVYVNWYLYSDIDEFKFIELDKYFSDIWYPSSDDIDIFDSTFFWVLSVFHDGGIVFTDFRKN